MRAKSNTCGDTMEVERIVPDVDFIYLVQVGCEGMAPLQIPQPIIESCLSGFRNGQSVSVDSGRWGCAFCAHAAVRTCSGRQKRKAQGSHRFQTKWARHEIRGAALQSEHIRKHSFSAAHKFAEAFFAPDAPLKDC